MFLGIFGPFANTKKKEVWRSNSLKLVCFLRGLLSVNLCFKELGLWNLTAKISSLSCIVLSQRSENKIHSPRILLGLAKIRLFQDF